MSEWKDLVLEWAGESAYIKQKFFRDHADAIVACTRQIAERLVQGGRILACGNGGSATDAQHIAVEFTNPVIKDRPPLPASALSADPAVVTSLANDFAFDEVFSRQVEVFAQSGDILIGLTTSGNSSNIVRAIEAAKRRGLLTIAFTGKGGGTCAELVDHAFAVPSHNILRIQECHLTLYHVIWDMVHTLLHYEPSLRRDAASERIPTAILRPAAEDAAVDPALAGLYPFLFTGDAEPGAGEDDPLTPTLSQRERGNRAPESVTDTSSSGPELRLPVPASRFPDPAQGAD